MRTATPTVGMHRQILHPSHKHKIHDTTLSTEIRPYTRIVSRTAYLRRDRAFRTSTALAKRDPKRHTTGGIPRWSPTLVLVARFSAHVWQSGRDAQISLTYGRMYLDCFRVYNNLIHALDSSDCRQPVFRSRRRRSRCIVLTQGGAVNKPTIPQVP
jgi:hypothetical protein